MEIKHESETSTVRPLIVTLFALVAIQALLLVPVLGLQRDVALAQGGFHSGFSIAAVALSSWVPAVTLVQITLLLMPARFYAFTGQALGTDGFANPFGLAALGLTAVFLFDQAQGVVFSLQTMKIVDTSERAGQWAVASLFAGAAMFIAAGWFIDRLGVRHGFWIVVAAHTIFVLLTAVIRAWEQLPMHGLYESFAPFGITGALMAATVWVTMLVLKHGGRMEFVAWPLLLLGLLGMQGLRKEMPEILTLIMPLTVALIGLSVFVLLRRASLLRLLLPLVGTLSMIAMLELWLIGTFSTLVLPLSVSGLVASTAVLTALWHEWWKRASLTEPTEKRP
jgi:hypothetical protein